jgi:hypothetical protein
VPRRHVAWQSKASHRFARLIEETTWALQADFLGEVIVDLLITGDAVSIDPTLHELARAEVTPG